MKALGARTTIIRLLQFGSLFFLVEVGDRLLRSSHAGSLRRLVATPSKKDDLISTKGIGECCRAPLIVERWLVLEDSRRCDVLASVARLAGKVIALEDR